MTTTNTTALLGLWAETSIHAGAGSSVDGIDLPIQREAHSGWPCVYGSSVKGALRTKAEDKLGTDNPSIQFVFGPDTSKASEHAGALLVSDARLLLLPVRSLTSHFKWVTCPALLERLLRDCKRLGLAIDFTVPKQPEKETALVTTGDSDLFLEEYRFTTQTSELKPLITVLSQISGIELEQLSAQLVIVHDDQFSYLSRYATPVVPHIAIDNSNKTVKDGALWYEESLPPETVLYCGLSAQRSRDSKQTLNAEAILAAITENLFAETPYLQLGGNETVGMGWCKITINQGA